MESRPRGRSPILGVVVAALGGLVAVPLGDWVAQSFAHAGLVGPVVLALLVASVSAWILRTWWAMLLVPAVYFVGYLGGAMLDAAIRSPYYLSDASYLVLAEAVFTVVNLLPLVAGALFGTIVAKRIPQRQNERTTRSEQ